MHVLSPAVVSGRTSRSVAEKARWHLNKLTNMPDCVDVYDSGCVDWLCVPQITTFKTRRYWYLCGCFSFSFSCLALVCRFPACTCHPLPPSLLSYSPLFCLYIIQKRGSPSFSPLLPSFLSLLFSFLHTLFHIHTSHVSSSFPLLAIAAVF